MYWTSWIAHLFSIDHTNLIRLLTCFLVLQRCQTEARIHHSRVGSSPFHKFLPIGVLFGDFNWTADSAWQNNPKNTRNWTKTVSYVWCAAVVGQGRRNRKKFDITSQRTGHWPANLIRRRLSSLYQLKTRHCPDFCSGTATTFHRFTRGFESLFTSTVATLFPENPHLYWTPNFWLSTILF